MADGRVDIVLPSGQSATVPEQDLARALAAGATVPQSGPAPGSDEAFLNSGLGQAITGVLGAGRAVTGGMSDALLSEGFGLAGGEGARKDALRAFQAAKEANPYADLAGEMGGLYLGGGGITAAGESAESGIARRFGEGLGGKVIAGGARGLVEGALIGQQHSISEDTLGDHGVNGEKMFQVMSKEALLGGAVGAPLGAAGYGLGKLFGREAAQAERSALEAGIDGGGSVTRSGLDEIAGAKNAGSVAEQSARISQETIEGLRKTGLTADQATELVDGVNRAVDNLTPKQRDMPGVVDKIRDAYIKQVAGTAERADVLKRGYELQAGLREPTEDILRNQAANLSKKLTTVFRDLEDTANEVQFAEKPEMMRKLVDKSFRDAARDAAASMFQEVEATVGELNSLASKGGSEGALRKVANGMKDLSRVFANDASEAGDYFIATDKLKRLVGRFAKHEIRFGKTEAEQAFTDVYQSLRRGLEDESAFGGGAMAQKELNATFAEGFARRNHLAQTVGQTIDRTDLGVKMTGGDFQKMSSLLRSLTGDATDGEIQGVKSVEAFLDSSRKRIAAVEKYADLSADQAAKVARGKEALEEFAQSFSSAKDEIASNNRLRSMQLVEREGRSVGGLVGMIGDVVTKPLTTMERLAEVRSAVDRLDKTIDVGLKKALTFTGKAEKVANGARSAAEKEIGQIRELSGNPQMLTDRVRQFIGPLSKVAPKIADEVSATALRALTFLGKEAPIPLASRVVLGMPTKDPRYSDQQIASWQAKRTAALGALDGRTAPEAILGDLSRGRLNRDAIRTIEYVSPKLFLQLQQTAQRQIQQMAVDGRLEKLTPAQQGAIASLLKVPPGKVWEPDFMLMMQAAKSYPESAKTASAAPPQPTTTKRPIKLDTDAFQTEAQSIEAR